MYRGRKGAARTAGAVGCDRGIKIIDNVGEGFRLFFFEIHRLLMTLLERTLECGTEVLRFGTDEIEMQIEEFLFWTDKDLDEWARGISELCC